MKKLTKRQWQSVYNSVCHAYMDSYAMMVDDAMRGFKKHSEKYGLPTYWDGEVFRHIFSMVKQCGIGYELDWRDIEILDECRSNDA